MNPVRLATLSLMSVAFGIVGEAQGAALVRHAPTINGKVEGSVQQMTAEAVVLNSSAAITGDLYVPGTPNIVRNGNVTYDGTEHGSGEATPTGYTVTLNKGSSLRHVVVRTNPFELPAAPPLKAVTGTRSVVINSASVSPGDFGTLRNLTLNSNTGQISVPEGNYGKFAANNGSGFTLGVAGASTPSVYEFQSLVFSSGSKVEVIGPVVMRVGSAFSSAGTMGSATNPGWLKIEFVSGGLTLNSGSNVYGFVQATSSTGAVVLNGKSILVGGVSCDDLTLYSGAVLRLQAEPVNESPSVTITSPVDGTTFASSQTFIVTARAVDGDGTIQSVDIYSGSTKMGQATPGVPPTTYDFSVSELGAGSYTFLAVATDDDGSRATSLPVNIVVSDEPPDVSFIEPESGAVVVAPAAVDLSVIARAKNGRTITEVDFFEGPTSIGKLFAATTPPSIYSLPFSILDPGLYVFTARVVDSAGLLAVTEVPLTVTALAAVPYSADFETGEGYIEGTLSGQLGWTANLGVARVTNAEAAHGAQSVALEPGEVRAQIEQAFGLTNEPIVFAEVFAKPTGAEDVTALAAFDVQVARFGFLRQGDRALLHGFSGDGVGGGQWMSTGYSVGLDATNRSPAWTRLTARIDFVRRKWDLYADGRMVAADFGFHDTALTFVPSILVQGDRVGTVLVDDVFVGWPHPLFIDSNRNGIDDVWEGDHGLSLSTDNRNLSPSGNGVTVVEAYIAGTDPNDFYNGSTPGLIMVSGDNQTAAPRHYNALPFVVEVRDAAGQSMANAPVAFSVETGDGVLAPLKTFGGERSARINIFTDSEGRARAYYEHGRLALKRSTIKVTAGRAQIDFSTISTAIPLLSGGGDASLLQDPAGVTRAWGSNRLGQLGDDGTVSARVMQRVVGLTDPIAAASLGATHGLAIVETGQIFAWGDNFFGQLGWPVSNVVNGAQPVPGLDEFIAVATGDSHSVALHVNGTMFSWGDNRTGQLGDGTQLSRPVPALIDGLSDVISISANGEFSAAVKADGSVWVWGSNLFGQFAQATPAFSPVPIQVQGVSGGVTVVAGRHHVLVLKLDGTVQTWGASYSGQLGRQVPEDSFEPAFAIGLSNIVQIAAGDRHSAALDANGAVWVWGANEVGQLGDSTQLSRMLPVQLSLPLIRLIACGRDHVVAMKTDDSLVSWGANGHGQLGAATDDSMSATPVVVLPPND